MALLNILSVPHKTLRQTALPVESVDDDIKRLMDDMFETMIHENRGVGLAANQVGVLKRVIVCHYEQEHKTISLKMVNPCITHMSENIFTLTEGCLSIPQAWSEVKRPQDILVTYLDETGKPQELKATHELSSIIQHEIDHLDGRLFIDHLSSTKKKLLLDRAIKATR